MASSPESPRKAPRTAADVKDETTGKLAGAKESFEGEALIGKENSYKLGEKGLTQKEKKNMTPADRAKYPRLEKGKKYIAVGGVDKTPFKQAMHDNVWYYEMAQVADLMLKNKDSITFEFPAMRKDPKYKERILAAVKDISHGSVQGVTEDFKAMIEKGRSLDDVYGAEGAFNVILAYGRAIDKLNNVEPGASIEYRLKLSGKRYSKLLGKKEKAPAVTPKVVPGQEGGSEKPMTPFRQKVIEKIAQKKGSEKSGFIQMMDQFLTDRGRAMDRIAVCVADKSMSEEDAASYRKSLQNLSLSDPKSPPGDEDWDRLELVGSTIERVELAIEKAEASVAKKGVELLREATQSVENVEFERQARQIISENSDLGDGNTLAFPKPPYPILKADTVEVLVTRIARDIVKAIYPADNLAQEYEKSIHGNIRGTLNAILKHSPEQLSSYRLSDDERVRFIVPILQEMAKKPRPVKRNRRS